MRDRERLIWTIDLRPFRKFKIEVSPDFVPMLTVEIKLART